MLLNEYILFWRSFGGILEFGYFDTQNSLHISKEVSFSEGWYQREREIYFTKLYNIT